MKKYLLGSSAIVLAIIFSAFKNEKYILDRIFMLITPPISSGVVSTNTNWKTASIGGQLWGTCTPPTPELACRIKLRAATTGNYFHQVTVGTDVGFVLNDATYAADQINNPGAKYFTITEAHGIVAGITQYWIIFGLMPSGTGLVPGNDYVGENGIL